MLIKAVKVFLILSFIFLLVSCNKSYEVKEPLIYQHLSVNSLISFTPYVLNSKVQVVGVLKEWRRTDDFSSIVLLPSKNWSSLNLEQVPSAIVYLLSEIDQNELALENSCFNSFVLVEGTAVQNLGRMSIIDISNIESIEIGKAPINCLTSNQ